MNWFSMLMIASMGALSVCCVFGNTLIIMAVCLDRSLRKPINFCMLSLVMSDLIVGIFNIPLNAASLIDPVFRTKGSSCKIYGYTEMLFLVASVQSLCLVSISRYLFVIKWNRHMSLFTPGKIFLMILATWFFSAAVCLPPLFGWSRYSYHVQRAHCFVNWKADLAYTYFCIGICFCTPVVVMILCYGKIYWMQTSVRKKLNKKNSKAIGLKCSPANLPNGVENTKCSGPTQDVEESSGYVEAIEPEEKSSKSYNLFTEVKKSNPLPFRKSDRDITKLCLLMVLMFFLCWLPYVITMLLEFYGVGISEYVDRTALFIGYMNSGLNPLVYGYRNRNVRLAIKTILCNCISCFRNR